MPANLAHHAGFHCNLHPIAGASNRIGAVGKDGKKRSVVVPSWTGAHANVCGIDVHPDDGILDGLRVRIGAPHHRVGLARRQMEIQVGIGLGGGPVASPGVTIRIWRNRFRHLNFNSTRHRASQSPFLAARTILRTPKDPTTLTDPPEISTVAPALPIPAAPTASQELPETPPIAVTVPPTIVISPPVLPLPPPMPASLFPPRALRDPVLSDEMTIAAPTGISNPAHISPLPRVLLPTNVNST